MTPVEKLQAAIAVLDPHTNALGPWAYGEADDGVRAIIADPDDLRLALFQHHPESCFSNDLNRPDGEALAAAELIVTLHASIPAILKILGDGLAEFERRVNRGDQRVYPMDRHLHLAESILGAGS